MSGVLQNLKYETELIWDLESGVKVHTREVYTGEAHELKLDMPIEFGGKGRFPCADDLFFSAVGGCILITFLYFKAQLGLRLKGLQVLVKGKVDLVGMRRYEVTDIEVIIHIETEEKERPKAEECVELTRYYCHLGRVLNPAIPLRISTEVQTH